jgi:hypothetical protein
MGAELEEPLPDVEDDYRTAALTHMTTLKKIDFWLSTVSDVRLAWIVAAHTLNLTSTRGWTLAAIAKAIGVSESKLTRSKAKFVKLIGIDAGGGIQFQGLSDRAAKRLV